MRELNHETSICDRGFLARGVQLGRCRYGQRPTRVNATRQRLNAAIVKPDIAFLERVLAQDYVHYRPHGNVENRAQYLEDRKSGSVDFDSLVADEIRVRLYGDTAIVTYRSTAKGKDQDGVIDEQRRWTRVFVRKNGRWQLVESQGATIRKP